MMGSRKRDWDDEWDDGPSGDDEKGRRGGRKGSKRSGHMSRADKFGGLGRKQREPGDDEELELGAYILPDDEDE